MKFSCGQYSAKIPGTVTVKVLDVSFDPMIVTWLFAAYVSGSLANVT